ncbi:MAG: hypothetical protein WDM92_05105 [Caulobacteraceae bacterium]
MSRGLVVLAVVLLGFLAFVVWSFFRLWALAGNAPMSAAGYGAMALAAVLTLGVGGGLMWLAFYSSRKGYDDRAGHDED